jgi:hypothetical protein
MTRATELSIPTGGAPHPAAASAPLSPLIQGERSARYHSLFAGVCETLGPTDVLEQLWIQDIVDLAWEVIRLRGLKADLMAAAAHQGMAQVLAPLVDAPRQIAEGWARRNERVVPLVEAALAKAGLTMDAVTAATFAARIADLERIDRMMAAAEARRNAALRELDRHRSNLALRLRSVIEAVEARELTPLPAHERAT